MLLAAVVDVVLVLAELLDPVVEIYIGQDRDLVKVKRVSIDVAVLSAITLGRRNFTSCPVMKTMQEEWFWKN